MAPDDETPTDLTDVDDEECEGAIADDEEDTESFELMCS